MTALLKFLHIGTIAIWAGGLIVLPFLFRQRRAAGERELDHLHRVVRFVYVTTTSPAAFLAISSGTLLIFLEVTHYKWFSLKMLLVGAMVMLHVLAGLITVRVFGSAGRFGRFSYVALTCAYLLLIIAILWIALAKPDLDPNQFTKNLFAPGALRQFFGKP